MLPVCARARVSAPSANFERRQVVASSSAVTSALDDVVRMTVCVRVGWDYD